MLHHKVKNYQSKYLSNKSIRIFIMSVKRNRNDKNEEPKAKKKKTHGHWSLGLLDTMKDPTSIIQSDDIITVIKDKYPKAEYHYLILPNEDLSSLKEITGEHIKLLEHMHDIGETIAKKHKGKIFKLGYHAEASMFKLHMHVISDDMKSNCLKNKKHWNSFTSDFFLKSKDVIENLRKNNKVILPTKEECKKFIDTPLKCHKCSYVPKNMPDLKKHILIHLQ